MDASDLLFVNLVFSGSHRFVSATVMGLNCCANVGGGSNHRADVEARVLSDLLERLSMSGIVHRNVQRVPEAAHAPDVDRDQGVTVYELLGHQVQQRAGEFDVQQ
jgi:hypothetical protein